MTIIYKELMESSGAEVEVIFANHPEAILKYADKILNCDIHTRARTKRILKKAGAKVVCGLDDIMTASVNGSGYNEKYGLLGSNKSTEDKVKLFPHQCQSLVEEIQGTATAPLKTPRAKSGNWRIRWFPRPLPAVWWVRPMN